MGHPLKSEALDNGNQNIFSMSKSGLIYKKTSLGKCEKKSLSGEGLEAGKPVERCHNKY